MQASRTKRARGAPRIQAFRQTVPVTGLDMRYPARAQPAAVPFNDFPPWTKDDERRSENLQSRGRRIRRKKPSDLTVRTLPIEAVHSGRRRDLLEYTVDAAGRASTQASDEAPSSDESGDNSDSPTAPNSPRPSVDHPGSSLPPPLMPLDPLRPPVIPLPTRSKPALDPTRLVRLNHEYSETA